tara:strand:+ start:3816 stop:4070 length:255 start_codon:yes stop_codon:yes gene_type:complete
MEVAYDVLLETYPIGTVFKAIGKSGMIYYGILDLDYVLILSCPKKGYTGRRLKHTSVGFSSITIPNNYKAKRVAIEVTGGTYEY